MHHFIATVSYSRNNINEYQVVTSMA